jgi:hypothetical protein
VLEGLTFNGLVVGHAVTINRGVPDGVIVAEGERVGKSVTKYMAVLDGVCVVVGVGVSDIDAVSWPTAKFTPHACGV